MAVQPNALKLFLYRLGFAIRETGQSLERVGCSLQGVYDYGEPCASSRPFIASPNSVARSDCAGADAGVHVSCPQ
jgi:hypothetical protein